MDNIIDQAKNEAGDTPDWLPNVSDIISTKAIKALLRIMNMLNQHSRRVQQLKRQ